MQGIKFGHGLPGDQGGQYAQVLFQLVDHMVNKSRRQIDLDFAEYGPAQKQNLQPKPMLVHNGLSHSRFSFMMDIRLSKVCRELYKYDELKLERGPLSYAF